MAHFHTGQAKMQTKKKVLGKQVSKKVSGNNNKKNEHKTAPEFKKRQKKRKRLTFPKKSKGKNFLPRKEAWKIFLEKIFKNPKNAASFQGPKKLLQVAKENFKGDITLKQIKQWLENEEVYAMNKPVKRNFKRGRVIAQRRFDQFDADLADMKNISEKNDNTQYLLIVIDVFSRFLWVEPLQTKAGEDIVKAFTKIFTRGQKPRRLRTDNGKEFTGVAVEKYFSDQNIEHFISYTQEIKAGYAERVIQTLKQKMWRMMRSQKSYRYIDNLQDLVFSYNSTKHSSIKMAPADVSSGDVSDRLFWSQYKPPKKLLKKEELEDNITKFKFSIGDHVRSTYIKRQFERVYNEKWTTEIFVIRERFLKGNEHLPAYFLEDMKGEEIHGIFYEAELQKAYFDKNRVWEINQVIKEEKGRTLVSWKGWPEKFNSWVDTKTLEAYFT